MWRFGLGGDCFELVISPFHLVEDLCGIFGLCLFLFLEFVVVILGVIFLNFRLFLIIFLEVYLMDSESASFFHCVDVLAEDVDGKVGVLLRDVRDEWRLCLSIWS